ncbi:unnamed protein product [Vicia faba]|uniref:Uncharacterized protein n=1 Tax=Vicia faba TaxID=3906 RepID=A0AAV1A4H4_VICFA|nr:unnamed protein product [Vicia faba]
MVDLKWKEERNNKNENLEKPCSVAAEEEKSKKESNPLEAASPTQTDADTNGRRHSSDGFHAATSTNLHSRSDGSLIYFQPQLRMTLRELSDRTQHSRDSEDERPRKDVMKGLNK